MRPDINFEKLCQDILESYPVPSDEILSKLLDNFDLIPFDLLNCTLDRPEHINHGFNVVTVVAQCVVNGRGHNIITGIFEENLTDDLSSEQFKALDFNAGPKNKNHPEDGNKLKKLRKV